MRTEWLYKEGTGRVVVFFNGWGMDRAAAAHLKSGCDVLAVYDYRQLEAAVFPSLSAYHEIYIVAWSMGVWAAANLLPELPIRPTACIALNGTERPVNDSFGIPENVYILTEKGMNERGREKFFARMLSDREDISRFEASKPSRQLAEQCEELCAVRKQSICKTNTIVWDKIFIGEKDVIFPPVNQKNWWQQERGNEVILLDTGHYPFYCFESWEEML